MKKLKFVWLNGLCIAIIILIFGCIQAEKTTVEAKTYPNPLKGKTWVISNNKILGLNPLDTLFSLTEKSDTLNIWNYYAIEFTDSLHFQSYDSWECGNDCFTTTFGKYRFVNETQISFFTDSITKQGTCNAPTKYTKALPGQVFLMVKNKDTITLKEIY